MLSKINNFYIIFIVKYEVIMNLMGKFIGYDIDMDIDFYYINKINCWLIQGHIHSNFEQPSL